MSRAIVRGYEHPALGWCWLMQPLSYRSIAQAMEAWKLAGASAIYLIHQGLPLTIKKRPRA